MDTAKNPRRTTLKIKTRSGMIKIPAYQLSGGLFLHRRLLGFVGVQKNRPWFASRNKWTVSIISGLAVAEANGKFNDVIDAVNKILLELDWTTLEGKSDEEKKCYEKLRNRFEQFVSTNGAEIRSSS